MVELRLAGEHLSLLWVVLLFAPDSSEHVELLADATRHRPKPGKMRKTSEWTKHPVGIVVCLSINPSNLEFLETLLSQWRRAIGESNCCCCSNGAGSDSHSDVVGESHRAVWAYRWLYECMYIYDINVMNPNTRALDVPTFVGCLQQV